MLYQTPPKMVTLCGFQLFYVLALIHWVAAEERENPFSHAVKHTLITTARNCMVHVNATEKDLEYIREEPPYPEKSACIIKCLLEKIGIVKNNKYSKKGFLMAVSPLVFTNKKKLEHMKAVSENCETEINHHEVEPCQLGNEVVTCIFKYAPELHLKA